MERFDPALMMLLLTIVHHAGELEGISNIHRELTRRTRRGYRKLGVPTSVLAQALPDISTIIRKTGWDGPEDRELLRACADLCREHGMEYTARAFDSLAERDGKIDPLRAFPNIRDRVRDELDQMVLLRLEPKNAEHFEDPHPFGELASKRFPAAVGDMEGAAQCFALGLGAACVFHAMRALEHALREMARVMKAKKEFIAGDRSWHKILFAVSGEIEARDKQQGAWKKGQRQFFTGASGLLEGVKDAWRNEYFHVSEKCSDREVIAIYNATAGFMAHLAKMPRRL